jgi:hypothetical protein
MRRDAEGAPLRVLFSPDAAAVIPEALSSS